MTPKTLRITLTPATSTALLCIRCGQFRCELAVSVGPAEAVAGMHSRCLREARAARRAVRQGSFARHVEARVGARLAAVVDEANTASGEAIANQAPKRSDVQAPEAPARLGKDGDRT
jgi:hypothetical protein